MSNKLSSPTQPSPEFHQSHPTWQILLAWGAVILLAISAFLLIWILPSWENWWVFAWLLLVALNGGLVVALMKGLEVTSFEYSRRCRMAFLLSLGWGFFLLVFRWVTLRLGFFNQIDYSFFNLLVAISGIFIGALGGGVTATGLSDGFWEDNSPPSPEIQEAVYRKHQEVITSLKPTPLSKRLFDILVSGAGLIVSAPIWLVSMLLIWLEDPGPVLFVKNSVGRGGKNFHQFKLRTMVRGAEDATGPVMAQEGDERVLTFGKFLRKTALDEIPQLINILWGEMSIVGPRPQRTVLVHEYLEEIPEYALRHQVLPGLAGLAQVAGDYYLTPRQKLRFDRLYIHHQSIGFDFRLMLAAFLITFWYRWKKDWVGRLPRRLLHN